MWRQTPIATMTGNQNVRGGPCQCDESFDERAEPVDAGRDASGCEQVGAGENGDRDGPGGDPGGWVGFGGLERLERPAQEHHRHDDQVEHESEAERRDAHEGEEVAGVVAEQ